jgi:hypothetical protein
LTLQPDPQAIANRGGPANLGSWSRIWRHGRSARQSIANFSSRRHVRDRGIPIHSPSSNGALAYRLSTRLICRHSDRQRLFAYDDGRPASCTVFCNE